MLMKGKICIVTGAASPNGIGRATVRMLASHGAKVALIDVSDTIEAAAHEVATEFPDGSAIGVRCDITSRKACAAAIDSIAEALGRVDALVHCAAIMKSAPYDGIAEADFDEIISINLVGAFNIVQAVASTMVRQGSGSIVNVSSVAAQRGGGLFGGSHYAASKGGVLSLTKSLARELGPSGVRINAVCPSLIETNFVTSAMSQERIRDITATIPLGRPGQPDEVAAACMFLASDLSSYITGATLDVNGGSHIH